MEKIDKKTVKKAKGLLDDANTILIVTNKSACIAGTPVNILTALTSLIKRVGESIPKKNDKRMRKSCFYD